MKNLDNRRELRTELTLTDRMDVGKVRYGEELRAECYNYPEQGKHVEHEETCIYVLQNRNI